MSIDKTRTKKADENFWIRSSKLLKIIIESANIEIKQIDKQYLTKVYWNYFENCYSEVNSCSAIVAAVTQFRKWSTLPLPSMMGAKPCAHYTEA